MMMKYIVKHLGVLVLVLISVVIISAQPESPQEVVDAIKNSETFQDLIGLENAIMSLLIILGGYLSPFLPWVRNLPNATYRVLAVAIVIVAGFVVFGTSVWSGAITYFFSTSVYEVFLKRVVPTKKPK